MKSYMLLLHESTGGGGIEASAEEIQAMVGEYIDWRNKVEERGRLVGGAKLTDDGGRHLRMNGGNGIRVTDGPYTEVKEALGGYFAIKANDYDEAVEIARDCPHLKYGWIELREVEPTH